MKLRKNVLQSIHYFDELVVDAFSSEQRSVWECSVQLLSALAVSRDKNPAEGGIQANDKKLDENEAEGLSDFAQAFADSFVRLEEHLRLPVELLQEYEKERQRSLLGQIFLKANELHALVDRVVLLAPHDVTLAIRTIQSACCQPYWNELSRAARGSKPRLTLLSDRLDNDSIQGVLDMLGAHQDIDVTEVTERWGVVIIDPTGDSPLMNLFADCFLPALRRQMKNTSELVQQCCVIMTSKTGQLAEFAQQESLPLNFELERMLEPSGMFSEAALLPAAILGVNVMEFVGGAAFLSLESLNDGKLLPEKVVRFTAANLASFSEVNQIGGVKYSELLGSRRIECYARSLSPCRRWYENACLAGQRSADGYFNMPESISPQSSVAIRTPLQRTDDPSSLVEPHSRLLPVVHQIVTKSWRYDDLFGPSKLRGDQPPVKKKAKAQSVDRKLTEEFEYRPMTKAAEGAAIAQRNECKQTVPQLIQLAADNERERLNRLRQPVSRIELPIVDELHIGYLTQWLLLSNSAETVLLSTRNKPV